VLDFLEAVGHLFEVVWFGIRKVLGIREPDDARPLSRAHNILSGVIFFVALTGVGVGVLVALLSR
jgi:hypothetical protein